MSRPEGAGLDGAEPDTTTAVDRNYPGKWVLVGRMIGAWGIHGELKVAPSSRTSESFSPGNRVYADDRPLTIERSRPHKKALVVKFESISDRDTAEGLRGLDLVIPEAELPPAPAGSYYQFQLVGLSAVTPSGEVLGKVARVLETGANDVYVVEGEDGRETLVPAIKDVVVEIDLEGGRMVVDPLPEL